MWHVGIEQNITVGEKRYRLGRLTRSVIREWLTWADAFLPNPIPRIIAYFDDFPESVQGILADEAIAIAEARKDFTSPEVSALWGSEYGIIKVIALLLGDDEDLAQAAFDEYGKDTLAAWIVRANGSPVLLPWEVEERAYRQFGLLPPVSPSRTGVTDWAAIDKSIFENVGLTPPQVDQLTLAELGVLLGSTTELSEGEKFERAGLWKKLTPAQRLQIATYQ